MRKSIHHLLLAAAICLTTLAGAQEFGELHGTVAFDDGTPLEMAAVTAFDGVVVRGAFTDEDGRFRIKPLPPGRYTVRCEMVGLQKWVRESVVIYGGQISRLSIVMTEVTVLPNPGLVVTGDLDPLIRPDGGTQVTLRYDQLKNMSSFKGGGIKGAIKDMASDIKTDARGTELYFRGSRNGSTLYFLDGIKIRENVPNIPTSALSSVTVYTGGLPARYGDCTGGVVVIETKSYTEDYYKKQVR
jgi:hypothetical protein